MVVVQKTLLREVIRANPNTLYVFGDNMARVGRGGQAAECRGEPNAVGIPTKWRPARDAQAYFSDSDYDRVVPAIDAALQRLVAHLEAGGTVVLPKQGVGTGLSELPTRAPKIYAHIIDQFRDMATRYGFKKSEPIPAPYTPK